MEYQPLVAADIEDRLLDTGVESVSIISKPGPAIDTLAGYDALIINATQDRALAQDIFALRNADCAFIVLHDDAMRARELFPGAAIVEIPFDSEAIRDALSQALRARG
ncbi:MAG: hypothetical protein JNJ53_06320 [Rhizobiales bacterium]|nr:hypothetical protein [Hyphomicrobiales bacterium]